MNTKGPLILPREEAQKIEHAILMLQPLAHQSWPSAVENYLILRWALGLGPASVREIVDALELAKFHPTTYRTKRSCRSTVHRVLWDEKFLVTDSSQRRWIRYHPSQYAWRPTPKSND